MGLYVLKFPYRKFLHPLAKQLVWIDPDLLSYAATGVALCTALCFYYSLCAPWLLAAAVALTFLRMTLNTIDGVIAIEQGKKALAGEIVNALPDRYSDIFVMLGIAFSGQCDILLGTTAAVSVLLVSYTGMLGKAVGVEWQHHGPLGKVERLILIMVASLCQLIWNRAPCFTVLMWIFIALAQVTIYNRVKGMLAQIKEKEHV